MNVQNKEIATESGIYKITCTVNGKVYIGSAVNLRKRKYEHFRMLSNGLHTNLHLQHAFNKYGKSLFLFDVIEIVNNKLKLIEIEYKYICLYNSTNRSIGYNTSKMGNSQLGLKRSQEFIEKARMRKCSDETKLKLRLANLGKKASPEKINKMRRKQSPETIAKRVAKNIGRKNTPETITKMSASHSTPEAIFRKREVHLGRKCSPEQLANIRAAQEKRSPGKSGYKGVRTNGVGFCARVSFHSKTIHIGTFDTAKEAHEAYLNKITELSGY